MNVEFTAGSAHFTAGSAQFTADSAQFTAGMFSGRKSVSTAPLAPSSSSGTVVDLDTSVFTKRGSSVDAIVRGECVVCVGLELCRPTAP
ncbi:hypothetical protein HAZT_HAZT011586 [Hyalella azteca]|uniref:Uncharacterized protein n=1 Tax=Hyalella azteca TaxID=294128 RepID=A0A6A0H883_HYAAZ|nr:hypothetical protein HAZT_HAZT011586 [Hyalella azteca]